MKNVILASQSPRRRELLGKIMREFIVRCDNSEEVKIPEEAPEAMVKRLALSKAKNVAEQSNEDALVIGADTVVVLDGAVLGKPKDEEEAFQMLRALSGRKHTVYTGVAVLDTETGTEEVVAEGTGVWFRELSNEEITAYIRTKEPMDKAGAYGIQDLGALFVEGIEGDYFNVVGLPLCRLGKLLKDTFSLELFV